MLDRINPQPKVGLFYYWCYHHHYHYYFMSMNVLPSCKSVYHMHVSGDRGGQKRALDPLELGLQIVMSYYVSA